MAPLSPLLRSLVFGLLLLLFAAAAAAGLVWWNHRDGVEAVTLYYSDAQAMALVPVSTPTELPLPTQQTQAQWGEAVLAGLKQAPAPLIAPVPAEVSLGEAVWMPPMWHVTLRMPAGEAGSTQERLIVGSLVRSLIASTPGCERVEVRLTAADGSGYEAQHLDLGAPLTASDFANTLASAPAASPVRATVWWGLPKATALVPVSVPLAAGDGAPFQAAFQRLVEGPPAADRAWLAPVVPKGIQAAWGGLEGDVATVRLAGPALAGPSGLRFVDAALLTLTEFSEVHQVRFLQTAKLASAQLGPYDLALPLARPARVNAAPSPVPSSVPSSAASAR